MHAAVIMGVGPDRGLGAQLCKRFAKEGLHVVAAGRTPASLDAVVADIEASGGKASSFAADATNEVDVAAIFAHAGPNIDLAIYNAGNNTPGRVLEMEADYFEKSWRVVCYGGFLFGREALRRMESFESIPRFVRLRMLPAAPKSGIGQIPRESRGFRSYYVLDGGEGVGVAVMIFEDRESANAANDKVLEFVQASLLDLNLGDPEITAGEVLVNIESDV
jgi:NAD(P)-dependent dehydrogenase (short-subunit alcohol dehydrogenase family)